MSEKTWSHKMRPGIDILGIRTTEEIIVPKEQPEYPPQAESNRQESLSK